MVYGGFWRRFAALMIDFLILVIPSVLAGWIIPFFGSFLVVILYRPFFESSELMGTPGKVFMGLAVTSESGERVQFKTALIRYLLSLVSGVMLCLGYLFNLFTPKRQTFHDIMAGTVVIRRAEMDNVDWVGIWVKEFKRVLNIQEGTGVFAAPTEGASPSTTLMTLENLHKLFQQGALTEAEYTAKKEELLKKI